PSPLGLGRAHDEPTSPAHRRPQMGERIMRAFLVLVVAVPVGLSLPGCQAKDRGDLGHQRTPVKATIGGSQEKMILVFDIDLSGSFNKLMADDGYAYSYIMDVLQKYSQSRVGTEDKLIIAQLSGTEHPLLWEGKPSQLRKDFPSAEAL